MSSIDFLSLADLDRDGLVALLDAAAGYKRARPHGPVDWLAGVHVALVMEKASTRTRVGFEIEGLQRNATRVDGAYENVVLMAILF